MSGWFKIPKSLEYKPEPAPTYSSPSVQEAAAAETKKMKKKGSAQTVLTGEQGLTGQAQTGAARLGD